jgi:hypothetical protein
MTSRRAIMAARESSKWKGLLAQTVGVRKWRVGWGASPAQVRREVGRGEEQLRRRPPKSLTPMMPHMTTYMSSKIKTWPMAGTEETKAERRTWGGVRMDIFVVGYSRGLV